LRRTTSTWTAAILGAALSAQAVSAQQSPTAANARGSSSTTESDPSFGMAAARGARNLLRNGLDYIDYQEFERALKYLREAERRADELNEPERVKLQEGIERAQRGLREAIGSDEPYALSERSHRSGDAAPAVAAASSGRFAVAKPQPTTAPKREGDDRGEPIQLAGAEVAVPPPPRRDAPVPDQPAPPQIELAPAPASVSADAPLELVDVEIPTPPPISRIEAAPASANAPTQAPEPDAAAMAQADLLAPLPDFERLEVPAPSLGPLPPREDEDVQLSNTEPDQAESAPAPIFLENPSETEELEAPAALDLAPAASMDSFNLPPLGGDSVRAVAPEVDELIAPAPVATPEAPAPGIDDDALDLPALPADLRDPTPISIPTADEPMSESEPAPAFEPEAEIEAEIEIEPETNAMPQPAPVADEPEDLPELPGGLTDLSNDDDAEPRMAAAPDDEPIAPAAEEMSFDDDLPELPDEAPSVAPAVDELAEPAPEFPPTLAPAPRAEELLDSPEPRRSASTSTLSPELQNRVEEVARRMEAEYRESQLNPQPEPTEFDEGQGDPYADDMLRAQTQIDISRAPSPAEARPINAIPVPEDWVPLGAREWSPQRKYWAAAATCHLPLYFQDPMLERYGHSVEKFLGPKGRFFSYPIDSPSQSTQRNQIVQPFASAGLFAFQILTLPYAMIVDPPWEAQYDLGYWRPGDKIPTDLYYLPLYGTGPPLKGKNY